MSTDHFSGEAMNDSEPSQSSCLWSYDPIKCKFSFTNAVYLLLGIPAGTDLKLDTILSLLTAESAIAFRQVLKEAQPGVLQLHTLSQEGTVQCTYSPIQESDAPVRFMGTMARLTEPDSSQLIDKKKYRALFENTISALFITRPDGAILEANNAACAMFGHSIEDFRRLGRQGIIDKATPGLHGMIKERLENGSTYGELLCIRSNGERFWCEFSSSIYEGPGGDLLASVLMLDISEKKKAMESLAQSERQLSNIFNTLNDIIFTISVETDNTYRFTSVNKQFLLNLNLKLNDVIGCRLEAVIPKTTLDLTKRQYELAIQKRETHRWEETVDVAGTSKTGIVSVTPVFDKTGRCYQLVGSVSDITERKTTEEALRKIMDQSIDVICTIDQQGNFVKVSEACRKVWGYEPEEIQQKPFMDLVYPQDKELTARMSDQLTAGIVVTNFENRYVRKDGSFVHMIWSARWDNEDMLMYCVAKDATHLKEAEQKAILSERRFRSLVQEGLDMIAIISIEAKYIYVSPSYTTIVGYTPEELVGTNAYEQGVHPEDRDTLLKEFRALMSQKKVRSSVYRVKRKDGEYIRMQSTGTNMLDDPAVQGIVINSEDVTEAYYYSSLDKLERRILEQNLAGEQLPNLLHDFVEGIEYLHEGMTCSLLQIANNKLINLASPNLPEKYVELINGLSIADNTGSCGTAAFTGKNVIVSDARIDTRWADYQHLVEEFNILSCWSYPVYNTDKQVVATFAAYHKYPKAPNELEKNTLERATQLVQIIFDNYANLQALNQSNQRYEYANKATEDVIYDQDFSTKLIGLGESYEKTFGYTLKGGPLPFSTWNEQLHPDDHQRVNQSFNTAVTDPVVHKWDAEYRYRKKDGSYATVIENGYILRDKQGVALRMIGSLRDVSKRKREEHRLKLMESVVTNISDVVLVTKAEPMDEGFGPEIVYVNDAFETMTGYKPEEVIGKTPRILQGKNTNREVLKEFGEKLRRWESASVETINYKKNGEEFWVSFSVTPLANDKGWFTHWLAIERDITEQKNREIRQRLIDEISRVFNETTDLQQALKVSLTKLQEFCSFKLAEVWLAGFDKKTIDLSVHLDGNELRFYQNDDHIRSFAPGIGLPGQVWKKGETLFWNNLDTRKSFIRSEAARCSGLKTAYGMPVKYKEEVIGALILGTGDELVKPQYFTPILEAIALRLGEEIHRKTLENELARIFLSAPDIICVIGFDGHFRKVNPAMSELLGYAEQELLATPFLDLVHPDDRQLTETEITSVLQGYSRPYFKNRYITKSGKVVWLAWTTRVYTEEKLAYSVARDVTEQKELEDLLDQSNRMAKTGSWEVDLIEDKLYWSLITKEIHEVAADFEPVLETALNFYKEGNNRDTITKLLEQARHEGKAWDAELQIKTAKGTERWVRTIGDVELVQGKSVRLYGSLQDIHKRKKTELAVIKASREHDEILESISDAFYAIDKSWNITYFNYEAENLLGKTSAEVMGKNFWEEFNNGGSTPGLSAIYHDVMEKKISRTFEFFYAPHAAWHEISAYPAENGIAVYFKNITERKHNQARILQKTRQLDAIALFNGLLIKKDDCMKALEDCLSLFGEVITADRVYFFENHIIDSQPQHLTSMKMEWTRSGINPELGNPSHHNLPFSELQDFMDVLASKNPYNMVVEDIDDAAFKHFLQEQSIKSILAVPVFTHNTFRGFIGFDDCTRSRIWTEEIITFLQTISINFSSAIENKDAEVKMKELNHSLETQTKELAASNAELEQFAFVASHDLQEPLRMITGFLTQLEKKYDAILDERGKKYIYFATDGAKRMRQIILDLLDYSRIGRLESERTQVEIDEVLSNVRILHRKLIEEKKVSLSWENMPVIHAVKGAMQQLLQNLVINAINYQSPGSRPVIKIWAEDIGTHWKIFVQDNGIGIHEDFTDKIFNIFQRLHGRDEYSGTGVGLAICKKIVSDHNGEIGVVSEEGKGSTFHFTIVKHE